MKFEAQQKGQQNVVISESPHSSFTILQGLLANPEAQDVSSVVAELLPAQAISRGALLRDLEQFLTEEACGTFLVEGGGGTGKSIFAAQVVRQYGALAHFAGYGDANAAMFSLIAQLDRILERSDDSPVGILPSSAPIALTNRLLAALKREHRLLFVIDGPRSPHDLLSSNFFGLPDSLPSGCYLVLTSRPGLDRLPTGPQKIVSLDTAPVYWLEDIAQQVALRLGSSSARDARDIAADSNGCWFYVDAVISSKSSGRRIGSIEAYFAQELYDLAYGMPAHPAMARVAGICAWLREPLPVPTIESFLQLDVGTIRDQMLSSTAASTVLSTTAADQRIAIRHDLILDFLFRDHEHILGRVDRGAREILRSGADYLEFCKFWLSTDGSERGAGQTDALTALLFASALRDGSGGLHAVLVADNDPSDALFSTFRSLDRATARYVTAGAVHRTSAAIAQTERTEDRRGLEEAFLSMYLLVSSASPGSEIVPADLIAALGARNFLPSDLVASLVEDLPQDRQLESINWRILFADPFFALEYLDTSRSVEALDRGPLQSSLPADQLCELLERGLAAYTSAPVSERERFLWIGEHLSETIFRWESLLTLEEVPTLQARIAALAMRDDDCDRNTLRDIIRRSLLAMRTADRIALAARLSIDDPAEGLWRAIINQGVAAAGRGPSTVAARYLLEAARTALTPEERCALADAVMQSVTCLPDGLAAHFIGAALPSVSAQGLREALALASERLRPAQIATMLRQAARNPNDEVATLAARFCTSLPSEVRGIASPFFVNSARPVGEGIITIDVAEVDFAQLNSYEQIDVFLALFRSPSVRNHLASLSVADEIEHHGGPFPRTIAQVMKGTYSPATLFNERPFGPRSFSQLTRATILLNALEASASEVLDAFFRNGDVQDILDCMVFMLWKSSPTSERQVLANEIVESGVPLPFTLSRALLIPEWATGAVLNLVESSPSDVDALTWCRVLWRSALTEENRSRLASVAPLVAGMSIVDVSPDDFRHWPTLKSALADHLGKELPSGAFLDAVLSGTNLPSVSELTSEIVRLSRFSIRSAIDDETAIAVHPWVDSLIELLDRKTQEEVLDGIHQAHYGLARVEAKYAVCSVEGAAWCQRLIGAITAGNVADSELLDGFALGVGQGSMSLAVYEQLVEFTGERITETDVGLLLGALLEHEEALGKDSMAELVFTHLSSLHPGVLYDIAPLLWRVGADRMEAWCREIFGHEVVDDEVFYAVGNGHARGGPPTARFFAAQSRKVRASWAIRVLLEARRVLDASDSAWLSGMDSAAGRVSRLSLVRAVADAVEHIEAGTFAKLCRSSVDIWP